MKLNEISSFKQDKSTFFKNIKTGNKNQKQENRISNKRYNIKFISFFIINSLLLIINTKYFVNEKNLQRRKYDIHFNYENYDHEIITSKIIEDSKWLLGLKEARFINGIIRKNKLKNCLEIGVANGGSAILILNAIKDIKNSILVSLDLNKELFDDPYKVTGYRVNEYFPELSKNWKLYTGDQPHKFLVDLNYIIEILLKIYKNVI